MVRNIVHILEDKCENGKFPPNFEAKIYQKVGFIEAKKIVSE